MFLELAELSATVELSSAHDPDEPACIQPGFIQKNNKNIKFSKYMYILHIQLMRTGSTESNGVCRV